MAIEQGWRRRFPFVDLDLPSIEALIQPFAAGARVLEAAPLSGGLRNTNYRVRLTSRPEPVVVRLFSADPSACAREAALERLVCARVPVPRVLHSEAAGVPPWNVVTWVDAERFDKVLKRATHEEIGTISRAAGRVLAAIHSLTFPAMGFLGPDLSVGSFDGYSGDWAEMLTDWLLHGRAGTRLGPPLTERLLRLVDDNAPRMRVGDTPGHLAHADYKPWNLLARDAGIAAVLDWEFAFSGSPLNDVGIYLRHSASLPPTYLDGFVLGYVEAGGELPDDWHRLARLTDLISLCYFLERPEDDPAVVRDVRPLIETTVSDFAR